MLSDAKVKPRMTTMIGWSGLLQSKTCFCFYYENFLQFFTILNKRLPVLRIIVVLKLKYCMRKTLLDSFCFYNIYFNDFLDMNFTLYTLLDGTINIWKNLVKMMMMSEYQLFFWQMILRTKKKQWRKALKCIQVFIVFIFK